MTFELDSSIFIKNNVKTKGACALDVKERLSF